MMAVKTRLKAGLSGLRRHISQPLSALWYRGLAMAGRAPGFSGAYRDVAEALAHVPKGRKGGYDHEELAEVSFEKMCQLQLWDYPVLYWLKLLHQPGLSIVDAGGHLGTRYIAFADHLDLPSLTWTVQDLPAIIQAAKSRQSAGKLPAALRFETELSAVERPDLLLASGLLQYFDQPVSALIGALRRPPRHVILNKVATREGASVTTLERIGPSMVPYQIRSRSAFEAELRGAGYRILDSWEIRSLAHVIPTHPSLGASRSLGYVLERAE